MFYRPLDEVLSANLVEQGTIVEVYNGWSRGSAVTSALIRRLDVSILPPKKYKSAINHVYRRFVFTSGLSLIFESHMKGGVQVNTFTKLLRACKSGKVTALYEELLNISEEEMATLWNRYITFEGKGYDGKLIPMYYLWNRLGRPGSLFIRRHRQHRYTCNEIFVETGRGIDPICEKADLSFTPERLFVEATGKPSGLLIDEGAFKYNSFKNKNNIWADIDEKYISYA